MAGRFNKDNEGDYEQFPNPTFLSRVKKFFQGIFNKKGNASISPEELETQGSRAPTPTAFADTKGTVDDVYIEVPNAEAREVAAVNKGNEGSTPPKARAFASAQEIVYVPVPGSAAREAAIAAEAMPRYATVQRLPRGPTPEPTPEPTYVNLHPEENTPRAAEYAEVREPTPEPTYVNGPTQPENIYDIMHPKSDQMHHQSGQGVAYTKVVHTPNTHSVRGTTPEEVAYTTVDPSATQALGVLRAADVTADQAKSHYMNLADAQAMLRRSEAPLKQKRPPMPLPIR